MDKVIIKMLESLAEKMYIDSFDIKVLGFADES